MLPDLPRKRDDAEADFGLELRKWVEKNYSSLESCTFELKDTHGKDSLPFSAITDVQRMNAIRTESTKGNLVRVAVGTIGAADYSFHRNAPAFIVIRFPGSYQMIRIDAFIKEDESSSRRSLTEKRAGEIAELTVKT